MKQKIVLSTFLCLGLGMGLIASAKAQEANASAGTPTGVKPASLMTLRLKPLSGRVSQDVYTMGEDIEDGEARVQANPDDPEAHFLLAVAYSRTPYVERALEELDRSRRLARKSKEGFALFDRKIAEYEQQRAKTPDDSLLLYRLGFGYYMRGYAVEHHYIKDASQPPAYFYDKAQQAFQHLLYVMPNDFMAMNYLGYLLAERDPEGNLKQAVDLWNQSLRISEGNPGAYMLLGQAALQQGDLRQAVEYSTKALKARNAWLEAHNINPDTVKVKL